MNQPESRSSPCPGPSPSTGPCPSSGPGPSPSTSAGPSPSPSPDLSVVLGLWTTLDASYRCVVPMFLSKIKLQFFQRFILYRQVRDQIVVYGRTVVTFVWFSVVYCSVL